MKFDCQNELFLQAICHILKKDKMLDKFFKMLTLFRSLDAKSESFE